MTGGMFEVTISDDVDTFVQQVTPANFPSEKLDNIPNISFKRENLG